MRVFAWVTIVLAVTAVVLDALSVAGSVHLPIGSTVSLVSAPLAITAVLYMLRRDDDARSGEPGERRSREPKDSDWKRMV